MMNNQEKQMNSLIGKRQEVAFKVEVKDGIVKKIHNAYIYQPTIHFKNNNTKLYENSVGK